MEIRLESLGELRLVGIPVSGTREQLSDRVARAWQDLLPRLSGVAQRSDPHALYGASIAVAEDRYTYWVAAPVSGTGQLPPGLTAFVIPARTYAVATVRGGAEQIDAVYLALGRWIEASGRRPAAGAFGLERYDERRQSPLPPYAQFDFDVLRPLE